MTFEDEAGQACSLICNILNYINMLTVSVLEQAH